MVKTTLPKFTKAVQSTEQSHEKRDLRTVCFMICHFTSTGSDLQQDQDQDSLLVKRRNDNHSSGPVIGELVPSSHQRSELSNTILCLFSR